MKRQEFINAVKHYFTAYFYYFVCLYKHLLIMTVSFNYEMSEDNSAPDIEGLLDEYSHLKETGVKCDYVNRNAMRFCERMYEQSTQNLTDELYFMQQSLKSGNESSEDLRDRLYGIISMMCPGQEDKAESLSDEDLEECKLTGDDAIHAMFDAFDNLEAMMETYKFHTMFINELRNSPENFIAWRGRTKRNNQLIYYVEHKSFSEKEKEARSFYI